MRISQVSSPLNKPKAVGRLLEVNKPKEAVGGEPGANKAPGSVVVETFESTERKVERRMSKDESTKESTKGAMRGIKEKVSEKKNAKVRPAAGEERTGRNSGFGQTQSKEGTLPAEGTSGNPTKRK